MLLPLITIKRAKKIIKLKQIRSRAITVEQGKTIIIKRAIKIIKLKQRRSRAITVKGAIKANIALAILEKRQLF